MQQIQLCNTDVARSIRTDTAKENEIIDPSTFSNTKTLSKHHTSRCAPYAK